MTADACDMRCRVKLENFEGPLDLLLYLIRKDEIDIYDIPIAYVTKQYIAYLDLMRELDLEVAGEYLYIASVLLNIKSRMLLPRPADAACEAVEDPREELTALLLEYQQFRNLGEYLRLRYDKEKLRYPLSRAGLPPSSCSVVSMPFDFFELMRVGWELLKRAGRTVEPPPREEVDIAERMEFIQRRLEALGRMNFLELFEREKVSSLLFVGTFFALLELVRQRQVLVRQRKPFGNIWVYRRRG